MAIDQHINLSSKSSLFWDVTQRKRPVPYRISGQPIAPNSQGQAVQEEGRQQLCMPYLNAYLSGVVKKICNVILSCHDSDRQTVFLKLPTGLSFKTTTHRSYINYDLQTKIATKELHFKPENSVSYDSLTMCTMLNITDMYYSIFQRH